VCDGIKHFGPFVQANIFTLVQHLGVVKMLASVGL
jgi:hypothetical protein